MTQAFSRRHTSNISTDAYGNDLAVTDAEGHVTSSAYNSYNEPCWTAPIATTSTSCNNPPPDATVNTYDSYGNLIATVDPLGNHTTHSYDAYGDVLSTTDPNGNTTTYTYNSNTGEVASEVDALGNKTTNTYYPDGQVETSVSPLGNVSGGTPANYTTSYSYNQSAWLTSETTPGSRTTTTTYDPDGNVLTTTDPQGYITNYGYDLEDRQCWSVKGTVTGTPSCTSPPADSTSTTYLDDTTNPVTVIDPNGNSGSSTYPGTSTTYSYGDLGYPDQPTEVLNSTYSDVGGTVTSTPVSVVSNVYNADGETCLSGSAPAGSGLWDSGGTHTCAWQPNYTYTRYDADGNPVIVEDPAGNDTMYSYDNALLPTLVTKSANAIGVGSTYTYDLDGQLIDQSDSAGNTTSYAYNPDGNLCWKAPTFASSDCGTPPSGTGVTTYAYDADDRRTAMTDNAGTATPTTTNYSYDANSEVLSVGPSAAPSVANDVSYTDDNTGDITCIAYPTAAGSNCGGTASSTNPIVAKVYNNDAQVTSVEDWNSNTTQFNYYGSGINEGDLNVVTYPTSSAETETYSLNPDDQVIGTAYAGGVSGTSPGAWTYSDDLMSTSSGGSTPTATSTTYSPKDQVLTDGSTSFSYGAVTGTNAVNNEGELKTVTVGSTTTTNSYNAGEELTSSVTGSTTSTYGYDQDGDRCWSSSTSSTGSCTSPPSGANTYSWNAYHQLTASNYNAAAGTYAYNGDGLRTTDTIGSSTQNFVWDEVTDSSQPLTLEDSTNAYIYGPTTIPIEQITLATGGSQYLASDPGGVRYVFGSASTLNETLGYSTFGIAATSGTSTTPFGFQGAYTDSDGLVYLINRYYDPATDQFLSVDPDVATTGEPYAFDGNDPLNVIDPLGLHGWTWHDNAWHWYQGNKYPSDNAGHQEYEDELAWQRVQDQKFDEALKIEHDDVFKAIILEQQLRAEAAAKLQAEVVAEVKAEEEAAFLQDYTHAAMMASTSAKGSLAGLVESDLAKGGEATVNGLSVAATYVGGCLAGGAWGFAAGEMIEPLGGGLAVGAVGCGAGVYGVYENATIPPDLPGPDG